MQTKNSKIWKIISIVTIVILVIAIIVLSVLLSIKRKREELEIYYDQKCAAFKLENINMSHGQIVFIGDSITDYCKLDNYYSELSLATYNRGISGDTTGGVLNRLKISLFDIKPSKVILMIGINDINWGVEKRVILENYKNILKEISTNLPQTEVFCVSILPENKDLWVDVDKNNQTIMEINPQIKKFAEESEFTYVDMFSQVADSNNYLIKEYSDDGLHLNHNGYVKFSRCLKPYLN